MNTIPVMTICLSLSSVKCFVVPCVLDFMCKIQQNCHYFFLSPTFITKNTFSFHEGKCQLFSLCNPSAKCCNIEGSMFIF